jgi:hypothetical protein
MADDKVVQLPGTQQKIPFVQLVKQMVEELPAQIEYYRCVAKIKKSYQKDLIAEGFTKDEAFTLVRDIFTGK